MKKQTINENYLDKIPVVSEKLTCTVNDDGIVTLAQENTGVMNRIAQKLFKKPKISYIHLDELGSFIWQLIDANTSIFDMGEPVKEHFGEKAEPLYPRLAKYFSILESYGFVTMKSA